MERYVYLGVVHIIEKTRSVIKWLKNQLGLIHGTLITLDPAVTESLAY